MHINEVKLDNALKFIEQGIEKEDFPGAAVVIGNKSEILRKRHFGNRCIYPEVIPMESDTLFDLASLTKVTATTTLFMVFMELGLVSLYDKVKEFLPDFTGQDKDEITLFNLLTHTAGFPPYKPLYKLCKDHDNAIKYIINLDLEYKPGTKVVYSDFSYIILGLILEMIGGDKLDKLCNKYVFKPLGMKNTCFNPITKNVAATEIKPEINMPLIGVVHDGNARFLGGVAGHAGLFSNIEDMAIFANMLINKGKAGKNSFLSPTTVSSMIRNYTSNLNEYRGLGWCVKGDKLSSGGDIISPSAFGHTGFTGTSIWVDMENNIYIVLLTNRVHPTRDNVNIIRFRRLFHNLVLSSIEY